ncbi:unnamed protein product [Bursaphelenchus okinawaensis]|uniref:G-protein coupled receptors family 1 profile domain-containing protein n=1 Tax=Bursaphelenchus okinawaensis TaxID=465554 RepID=A0A811KHZ6_9BILA|nr:unnamed protein product [Bursaphelenchus okinawaensis]CAG9103244.1 unnamed protein product [Bursaphelenchus okinawaensis]
MTNTMAELLTTYSNQSAEIAEYVCSNIGGLKDLYCGEFPIKHTLWVEYFVWVAFSSLITVALVGNAIVMWIIVHTRVMHSSFNYFLFNMALADFLMALLNTGTTWTFNFYYDWWYGSFCHFNHFFGVAPTCISVFTMMVVSHDRCMAIVDPLGKRAMSRSRAVALIIAIWIVAALCSLPNILNSRVETRYYYSLTSKVLTTTHLCKNEYNYKFIYDDALFVVQYAIPLLVLTYTFARILYALRRDNFPSSSRISQPRNLERDKRKIVKMLALVVIIFMVCWLPYQLYHMFPDFFMAKDDTNFGTYCYLFFYWLAMSACMYNPIIYCVFNARFRAGFIYVFRWLPCIDFITQDPQGICNQSEFSKTRAPSIRVHNKTSNTSAASPLTKCSGPTPFFPDPAELSP